MTTPEPSPAGAPPGAAAPPDDPGALDADRLAGLADELACALPALFPETGVPVGTAVPGAGGMEPVAAAPPADPARTEGEATTGAGGTEPPSLESPAATHGAEQGAVAASTQAEEAGHAALPRGFSPRTPDVPGGSGVPTPMSAEDDAALRLARDLMARLAPAASAAPHVSEAAVPEAPADVSALPTTDEGVRALLGEPAGVVAATPAAAPAAPDLYFLPRERPATEPLAPVDGYDVATIRRDFPILHQTIHGHPLAWLDNAATTQKPRAVIDTLSRFYERDYSNIHRGAHSLAARATDAYEAAREKVRRFLGAASAEEIVFVRGTTEAINLVAQSWGRSFLQEGDEIVLTTLEHHANIVPWQFLRQELGVVLKIVPVSDRGEILLDEYGHLLGPRTKLVAMPHVSNALGTVVPVREMAEAAHRHGARVLIDGAQSVPHLRANVQEVAADFYVFSGHKLYGPSGVGALYAKKELLEQMPPWQGGGSMIRDVTFEQTTFEGPPAKFEAGTPTIADAVGLGAAIDYVERLGLENIARYEHGLLAYGMERLAEVPGLRFIGTAPGKVSVMSFILHGTRPEDVGRYLDAQGIAVRSGHHCAQPTMQRFGLTGTVRPSLGLYNTPEEIDRLVDALKAYPHA